MGEWLACLVRDFLKIEYLDIAFAEFGAFRIQLIEAFFANTIKEGATHSSTKIFYQGLHDKIGDEVTVNFFQQNNPWFSVLSQGLFDDMKTSYDLAVVAAVLQIRTRINVSSLQI